MKTCDACGRDFHLRRGLSCPWCGYNNGPGLLPRTEDSMQKIERRRDREVRRLRREQEVVQDPV
jgi:uncharacterized Zn finger protein (UPF0148 family)